MGEFFRLVAATLVGALVTFLSALYFQHRSDIRETSDKREADYRELTKALRLLFSELRESHTALETAKSQRTWWSSPPSNLPVSTWQEYKPVLGGQPLVNKNDWDQFSDTYFKINELNVWLSMCRDAIETKRRGPINQLLTLEAWPPGARVSTPWQYTLDPILASVDSCAGRMMERLEELSTESTATQPWRPWTALLRSIRSSEEE